MENTKSVILYSALTLFSEKGYAGVSMRDIAAAVGIKAASIYNHFRSKEDIFSSIIAEMARRYSEAAEKARIPHGEISEATEDYMNISEDALIAMAEKIFLFFLKDDFAAKFRRMLTIEQYGSEQSSTAFHNFFINGALDYNAALFKNMIKQGGFIECDPYTMSLHFYAPIFLLLYKYDRMPEKEQEALDALRKHIRQFSKIYSPHGEGGGRQPGKS